MHRVELKGDGLVKKRTWNISAFLMHRVELKVAWGPTANRVILVPNAPCGVERAVV